MPSMHGAMTDDRKANIWRLWQQGHPINEIGRTIDKPADDSLFFLALSWWYRTAEEVAPYELSYV